MSERVTKIVNNIELSIVPTMNPDMLGRTHENANGVDLNQDFPSWHDLGKLKLGKQAEVKSMIIWIMENPQI